MPRKAALFAPHHEAGGQAGYAPDCKAPSVSQEINNLDQNRYQDISETKCERDNRSKPRVDGRHGRFPKANRLKVEGRIRASRMLDLVEAIARAHPEDARDILTAGLVDLSQGPPSTDPFGSVREDAQWWAAGASPAELLHYATECLKELPNRPLHLAMRKKLFTILWRSFPKQDQVAFLTWANGEVSRGA